MSAQNTIHSYGTVAKTFHWLTVLLMLAIIPLGKIAYDMPYDTAEQLAQKAWLFSLHKTLGLTLFFVALARILWAISQPRPADLHPDRKFESLAAHTVHWALYGSLVAMPLSGWIHHAATEGFAPILWPFSQDLLFVPNDVALAQIFGGLHLSLKFVLIGAVLLHIAGALKHALIDRDGTMTRMTFGPAPTPPPGRTHNRLLAPTLALAAFGVAVAGGALTGKLTVTDRAAVPTLASVASEWAVEGGSLEITVQQFGAPVSGQFADWTASISFDDTIASGSAGEVSVLISIPSLTLGSVTTQALDTDFFAATSFPTATYAGPILRTDTGYFVDGVLTLKGLQTTAALPFDLALDGDTATATGTLTLDRRTFEMGATYPDESQVGFAVKVNVSLTATR